MAILDNLTTAGRTLTMGVAGTTTVSDLLACACVDSCVLPRGYTV